MSSDKVFPTIGVSLAILLVHAALASSDDGARVSRPQDSHYLVQSSYPQAAAIPVSSQADAGGVPSSAPMASAIGWRRLGHRQYKLIRARFI
jgi:hypothetical protein